MEVRNKNSKVSERKACDHRNRDIMSSAHLMKKKRSSVVRSKQTTTDYIGFAQSNRTCIPMFYTDYIVYEQQTHA